MKEINLIDRSEIPENFTGIIKFSDGSIEWYKEGKLHREDGPAIEYSDGFKMWYVDGIYAGNSNCRFNFTNRLVEIKQHKVYSNVKIYIVLDSFKDKYSLIFVDGMEKLIVS